MLLSCLLTLLWLCCGQCRAYVVDDYQRGILTSEVDSALTFRWIFTENNTDALMSFSVPLYADLHVTAKLTCSEWSISDAACDMLIAEYARLKIGEVDTSHSHFVPRTLTESGLNQSTIELLSAFISMLNPKKCFNQDATNSLKRNTKARFTISDLSLWQGGGGGNWISNHHVYVPCGADMQWWSETGTWQAVPMYSSQFNKDVAVARCPTDLAHFPFSCDMKNAAAGTCFDDYIPFCGSYVHAKRKQVPSLKSLGDATRSGDKGESDICLAYTFGVDGFFNFEGYLIETQNCEVHTFDPSDDSRAANLRGEKLYERLFFHYVGLGGGGGGGADVGLESVEVSSHYGRLGGSLVTLGSLMEVLGHSSSSDSSASSWNEFASMSEGDIEELVENLSPKYLNRQLARPVSDTETENKKLKVLKIDCEGCEWRTLYQIATETPSLLDNLCTIVIEMHLSTTLKVATAVDLQYVASFFELYILGMGFRVQTVHPNPGDVQSHRYNVNPVLVELGLDAGVCCYDVVFHRKECTSTSSQPSPHTMENMD